MDNSVQSDEGTKSLLVNEQVEQTSSTLETSNIPGSQKQLQENLDSEDSEDIEDVKVCDICGDAGLEELLAVCSRCTDGAEHTYCMQKKLKELPEGDWLCEECKFKEETGNHNADMLETTAEDLRVQNSTKSNQNTKSDFDPKCLPELDTKALDSEERRVSERPQSPQISAKRKEDNLEVHLKTSGNVLESTGVSTRTDDAKNKSFLSREGSFIGLGADKAKQGKPATPCGGQYVNDSFFARSQTFSGPNSSKMLDPLQSSRGPLSKSVSFNMKPKVQFIECIPPCKQNTSKESNETRKGQVKKMSESGSFKSIRLGCSNAESIIKSQPLLPAQAEDHKGLKERNIIETKDAMPQRPVVNPAPVAFVGNLHLKGDPEVDIVSESKVLDINGGSYDKDNSGYNEGKLSYVSKSFGRSSILTAKNPCQTVPKEDIHEISGADDRSCSIPSASSQRTAPQVVEFSHGNDKVKDATFLGISKQAASGGSGLLRCKKCNETGHPTQFCSIDKLSVTALRPSASRIVRDLHNRSNKIKDAADAPILKSRIQNDIRLPNHTEKFSMPSSNSSYEVPSKDLLSDSSSCLGNSGHLETTTYGQNIVRSTIGDSSKTAASVNVNLQAVQVEASCAPRENNLNPVVTILDQLNAKSSPQVLNNTASIPADILRSSVIPELDIIWQGGFEVLSSGRLSKACEGIQAHLSTYASPKVVEAAVKLPCRVQLEEVTYLSSWPCQYQGHVPGEHNIALFFFAKDIDSYEKNYSKLLEDMIKNDLALKGNIAGAELLVFPSNKLPQNSQRWNRLFFLWGVFRRRQPNCLEILPQLQEKPLEANLNSEMLVQDLPIPIPEASVCQKLNHNEIPDNLCDRLNELKESTIYQNSQSSSPIGPQMNATVSCSGVENKVNCLNNSDSEGREVNPLHHKEKMEEKGSLMERNGEELIDLRPNRKRSFLTAVETISHAAGVSSKCSDETMHLNQKVDFPPVDDRREHKKMKPESIGQVSCGHQEETFSSSLSSKIHPLSANFSSHSFDRETVMPLSFSIDESCLFPVKHVIQFSDGEYPADIPNLELALGAKKKLPEEEILAPPSSNTGDDMASPSSNSGDDMAASLSLSLAFHSS